MSDDNRLVISTEDLDDEAGAPTAPLPIPPQQSLPDSRAPTPRDPSLPPLPGRTSPAKIDAMPVGGGVPVPPNLHYHQHVNYQQSTNGMAIASLVLSLLWLYWLGSILAVIFGHVARAQIRRRGGVEGGDGMAIAGLVIGYVGLATLVLFVIALVSASNASTY